MSGNDRIKLWLLTFALAGATGMAFFYCFAAWRKSRLVGDTPTSRIRSAAQGYVELSGRGLMPANARLKAPLSGMPCIWWQYRIERRGTIGRWGSWTALGRDTSATPFVLDDGTGQCLIDPSGAEVFAGADDVWYGSTEWPEYHLPKIPGLAGRIADAFAGGRYRYIERRLLPDERLYAIGSFSSRGGTDGTDRAEAELLHAWKHDQKTLLARFDADHDGSLCAEEWDHVRVAAHEQAVSTQSMRPPPAVVNTLSKPEDGRPFLLAASDQDSLSQTLRRRAFAGAAAFVGGTGGLVWMLTHVW